MKPLAFGDLHGKAEAASNAKRTRAVADAVRAMDRLVQLGLKIVKRCDVCIMMPHLAEDDSFPCEHRRLYDASLRSYGLDVLNAAMRIREATHAR